MWGVDDFFPSPMANVDPDIGRPYATVGGTLLMYKMMMIGTAALAEVMFMKWRRLQRERRQRLQQAQIANILASYDVPDAESPFGFDFGRLDEQDAAAAASIDEGGEQQQ